MVEHKTDRSGKKKLIKGNKSQAWENLIFKLGLVDAHHCDEFDA